MKNSGQQNERYGKVANALHWLIAGLIVGQYLLAEMAKHAEEAGRVLAQLALLANHKSIGITVLVLAIIRLLWRLTHPPSPLPASLSVWQRQVSGLAHWLLYVLLFALPVSGWLMSSAKNYSVSWFNLLALPDFVAADKALAERLGEVHELLGEALLVLAIVHVFAAFKHYLYDKDGIMQRMATVSGSLLFVASAALVTFQLGFIQSANINKGVTSSATSHQSELSGASPGQALSTSSLPVWNIDYANSTIKFSAEQAGAPFTGQWQQWQATMQFSEKMLSDARFDVRIDIASVTSGDAERDGYIVGEEFFDQANYQTARFFTEQIYQTENGYSASAKLTMKGITQPIDFKFNVASQGDQRTLTGTAVVDRLAWNIGTGDWSDTSWVGRFVDVRVHVIAHVD